MMLLLDTLTRTREAPGDRIEVPSSGWGAAKLVDEPLARRSGVNFTGRQAAWQRGAGICVQSSAGDGPGNSGVDPG